MAGLKTQTLAPSLSPSLHPSLSQCSRPFLGEQGGEATVCKPRSSFYILCKASFISSTQKAMPLPATSKPGIVHNPDLVSLYNGCYLYEGQFVNSTCSFNKRMFYKKKKRETGLSGFTEGKERWRANCGSLGRGWRWGWADGLLTFP